MTVLQALNQYYGRMKQRGDVVPPGYSMEPVGIVISLRPDGSIAQVYDRCTQDAKRGSPVQVPKWFGRSGQGSTPYLFWDNTGYALGVTSKPGEKVVRDHEAFKALHLKALVNESDEGLVALRHFLERWMPEQFQGRLFHKDYIDLNVAFRLESERALLHDRPAAAKLIETYRQSADSEPVFCLVTGEPAPGVRLHPKIKGVRGTSIAEVPLVSFKEPAFCSYGKDQGFNAPTSEQAAFQYGAALNQLLGKGRVNNLLIGDTTTVFWAEAKNPDDEDAAAKAEDLIALAMDPPDDDERAKKLRDALADFRSGKPLPGSAQTLSYDMRFYILGLAPNAARIAVRFWLVDSFGNFFQNLIRHFEALHIEPTPWNRLPSVRNLLIKCTVRPSPTKSFFELEKDVKPQLAGETTRAVLLGQPYPRTLLAAVIMRLRAGDTPTGWHAAVIKACINRHSTTREMLPVARDPDFPDPAYQLGRLFAVLEAAQYAALGKVNASIADRYYGAASATPARVFGTLLRNARNHISDALKHGKGKWVEPRLNEIFSRLPTEFPKTLNLEEQGRFAVGYYHERAWRGSGDAAQSEVGDEE